jgi:dTMP kinase
MARGVFITFEGGEGCGKSTQAAVLKDALERSGRKVLLTREPGGTWLSEEIRALLKDQSKDPPCNRAETLLFLAARAQLVERVILPALERGEWVVSDRFSDSTLAYQGHGRGLPLNLLAEANGFACRALKPDITFLFDLPPEEAKRRMRERETRENAHADRIEREASDFHERIRRGFAEMAAAEPERFVVVDATSSRDEIAERIWTELKRFG